MFARRRSMLPAALALALVAAPSARAQDLASPAPATATLPASSPATPAGPVLDNATVGVRHLSDATETEPQPRRGSTPGTALMIVGGAAVLVGLVIGGGAGAAIAVAGAVIGLYGLYQYLQ